MTASDDAEAQVEVLFRDAATLVAHHKGMVAHVRWGAASVAGSERVMRLVKRLRAEHKGPVVSLSILEEGAALPEPEVANKQREILGRLVDDPQVRFLVFVASDGVEAMLMRASARHVGRSRGGNALLSSLDEAARICAEHLGAEPREVLATLVAARALATKHRSELGLP